MEGAVVRDQMPCLIPIRLPNGLGSPKPFAPRPSRRPQVRLFGIQSHPEPCPAPIMRGSAQPLTVLDERSMRTAAMASLVAASARRR
jgi:hypothetical protein